MEGCYIKLCFEKISLGVLAPSFEWFDQFLVRFLAFFSLDSATSPSSKSILP